MELELTEAIDSLNKLVMQDQIELVQNIWEQIGLQLFQFISSSL